MLKDVVMLEKLTM
nr:hypothetical protein [Tanacetum cinerariifolium]